MAILAVWALLLAAAPAHASIRTVADPGVTIKIGTASLEEYTQGDPANRLQLIRSR